MQLSEKQSAILIGGVVVGCAVQTIAGHYLVNKYEKMEERYNDMVDAGQQLHRLTVYAINVLEEKMPHLDGFDEIVFDHLAEELIACNERMQKHIDILEDKPKNDGEGEES